MKRNINDKYLVRIIETFADVDARWLITGKYGKEDYEAEYRQKYLEIEKTFLEKLEILEKSHKALIKAKDATIHDKEYIISMKDEIINFLKQ